MNTKNIITVALLICTLTVNAIPTIDDLQAQLKVVQQKKDAAFNKLESWLSGYAAWVALCATLGCEKQAELIEKLQKCKKAIHGMLCIEDALALLDLSPAHRKEALKYLSEISQLVQQETALQLLLEQELNLKQIK